MAGQARYGTGARTVSLADGLRWAGRSVLLFCVSILWAMPADAAVRIAHYDLQITPDFATQEIRGRVQIHITAMGAGPEALQLDIGELMVESVQLDQSPLPFHQAGSALHLQLPTSSLAAKPRVVTVVYQGKPTSGLRFDASGVQVSTAFSTSQWMPVQDDPSVRATLDLTLVLPNTMVAMANGDADLPRALQGGLQSQTWHLRRPSPSYLYGFVAGDFRQVKAQAGAVALQFLAPPALSAEDIQRVFADSADMLRFYAERAGVPYPHSSYGQAILRGPAAQEMASFSVMGERYAARVLADPQAIWLGAHEAAHTWWGNGLTNRSWRHFWLNEGIATFMTAAYLEHRFGRAEYMRQIDAAHTKVLALRAAGQEKSLVFPDWDQPTAADRSLVYDKGAWVVHALREHMGEDKFWAGLKLYTQTHWGQSVETADFQAAMEKAYGQSLAAFFDEWVYFKKPST